MGDPSSNYPPSLDNIPNPESSSSSVKEHWRVRLERYPLPGGLRYEDHPLNKRDMMSRPPEKLLRRSPRLEDKNTRPYILYPPYYGNGPAKKLRRPRKNPMIIDYKEQARLYELNASPPPMIFTPDEQKEIWNELISECSEPSSPKRSRDEDMTGYVRFTKLPIPASDVSHTPQYPVLAKVNAATLAAIGMKVRRRPDGRMTGYLDS